MAMAFYTGSQFPAEYQNDAFITMRGSWNRSVTSGYKVVRLHFENGQPAHFEDFLTGFLVNNNKSHFARLVGVAQHPAGSLLAADDTNAMNFFCHSGRYHFGVSCCYILKKTNLFLCLLASINFSQAQSNNHLSSVEKLVKQEGELFIVVDRPKPNSSQVCTEENSISNVIKFTGNLAFVNYINYTELFCEAYVLKSHYTYQFNLEDIDPATLRIIEKRYDYGIGALKEGNPYWFEVQLFTKDEQPAIQKRDVESRQTERVATVSLIFKSKTGARQALTSLKSVIAKLS